MLIFNAFWDGQKTSNVPYPSTAREDSDERVLGRVLQLARAGEYRRAVQLLTSNGLAEGSAEDLATALQQKFRIGSDLPQPGAVDVAFALRRPTDATRLLERDQVRDALRGAPQKTGAGASGGRMEHWQVLLDDAASLDLLADVLDIVARGAIPGGRLGDAAAAFLVGFLTPLAKVGGGLKKAQATY